MKRLFKTSLLSTLIYLTNFCIIGMNSDGTTALNKNVDLSTPSTTEKSRNISNNTSTSTEDGWGGVPKGFESELSGSDSSNVSWYSKKFFGKANEKSKELKSPSLMEVTCKESIKKENGKTLIESALVSADLDLKPETLSKLTAKVLMEDSNQLFVSDCRATSGDGTYSECECALSYPVDGGKQGLRDKFTSLNKNTNK